MVIRSLGVPLNPAEKGVLKNEQAHFASLREFAVCSICLVSCALCTKSSSSSFFCRSSSESSCERHAGSSSSAHFERDFAKSVLFIATQSSVAKSAKPC